MRSKSFNADPVLTYLTTDHLGTPILASDANGAVVWEGGMEPFGRDWAAAARRPDSYDWPGQWQDPIWDADGLDSGLYYNAYRWKQPALGRYSGPIRSCSTRSTTRAPTGCPDSSTPTPATSRCATPIRSACSRSNKRSAARSGP